MTISVHNVKKKCFPSYPAQLCPHEYKQTGAISTITIKGTTGIVKEKGEQYYDHECTENSLPTHFGAAFVRGWRPLCGPALNMQCPPMRCLHSDSDNLTWGKNSAPFRCTMPLLDAWSTYSLVSFSHPSGIYFFTFYSFEPAYIAKQWAGNYLAEGLVAWYQHFLFMTAREMPRENSQCECFLSTTLWNMLLLHK